MEVVLSTFIFKTLGYILKGVKESKATEEAKEEVLTRFWNWIKPKFNTEISNSEDFTNVDEEKICERLIELIKDEDFFRELEIRVSELEKSGIKEKNIVNKDIIRVKKIKIGDKEYDKNEMYTRKNIVEGNIEDADEFILGDGH